MTYQVYVSAIEGFSLLPKETVIFNDDMWNKPKGAFWTSTYVGEPYVSEWLEWCRKYDAYYFGKYVYAHIYEIVGEPNVLRITDFREVPKKYLSKRNPHMLDFEKIYENYDAVNVNLNTFHDGDYQAGIKIKDFPLAHWCCESTAWKNPENFLKLKTVIKTPLKNA